MVNAYIVRLYLGIFICVGSFWSMLIIKEYTASISTQDGLSNILLQSIIRHLANDIVLWTTTYCMTNLILNQSVQYYVSVVTQYL